MGSLSFFLSLPPERVLRVSVYDAGDGTSLAGGGSHATRLLSVWTGHTSTLVSEDTVPVRGLMDHQAGSNF